MSYLAYMHGALTALCIVVALFFVRNWRRAQDRFFLLFAIAFVLFAIQWAIVGAPRVAEHAVWPYGTRLAAFVVILVAIVDKNRRAARG
jgi:ABC-type uncharacterized transport system YnjBCD permease subunit